MVKRSAVFELLDERLQKVLRDRKIRVATLPQEKLIPHVLNGEDVLLLSPTGSGKTEAAVLPLFSKILKEQPARISTLYITPLRALNRDMLSRLVEYASDSGISVQVKHSDISDQARREIVRHPADVLITTPESLQIMLNGKRLRQLISSVKYVVVDEVHELAQNERGSQFSVALERLRDLTGGYQIIGLSATIGNPEMLAHFVNPLGDVKVVRADLVKQIEITPEIPEEADQDTVDKMGCDPQYAGSIKRVWDLISTHRGTLVFVNTRSTAEDMAFRLKMWLGNVPVLVHHGSLSKDSRETAERDFKEGKIKALICTSSLELGIDIGSADLVIQFNSPRQVNKMAQRVGRSGHWIHKTSVGVVVCNDMIEMEESIAIATLVKDMNFEDVRIREGSLATLANQVILELYFTRRASIQDLYRKFSRAYPFRNVTLEDFTELVEFLASIRKVWLDGDIAGKRSSSLHYYLENISMIPSEKNYRVIDVANKKFIGTLDERYVVNEIEPGSYFVIKGNTWRTIRVEEERILVEPFLTPAIAPKWSGEDIPVLPDVTKIVSSHRKSAYLPNYLDEASRDRLSEWYENSLALEDKIMVDSRGGEIVIQVLLGTRGNFTLGEVMASFLTASTGESVEMDYSPYHVYLRSSRHVMAQDVLNLMKRIERDQVSSYIAGFARRSRFFNGVFLYEARKFGIVSNKTELGRVRFEKVVDAYHDTVLYKDSVRKLISDYMDLTVFDEFLERLQNGSITAELSNKITDSSQKFLSHYLERVMPIQPTRVILDAVKNRLLNEQLILVCTRCKTIRTGKVREHDNLKCLNCGSTLVAAFSEYEREKVSSTLSGKPDAGMERRIMRNAHLVKERGKTALFCLAARGVGTETARRLLEVSYVNDDDLIKAILNAEMEYSRNRRFWD